MLMTHMHTVVATLHCFDCKALIALVAILSNPPTKLNFVNDCHILNTPVISNFICIARGVLRKCSPLYLTLRVTILFLAAFWKSCWKYMTMTGQDWVQVTWHSLIVKHAHVSSEPFVKLGAYGVNKCQIKSCRGEACFSVGETIFGYSSVDVTSLEWRHDALLHVR